MRYAKHSAKHCKIDLLAYNGFGGLTATHVGGCQWCDGLAARP